MKKRIFVLLVFFTMFAFGGAAHALTFCSWTISPTSHSFSSSAGSIPVTVTSNCKWSVTKSDKWITLSTTSGSGNGTVTVGVLANSSIYSRSGTVTIADKTFTVEQAGVTFTKCIFSISPTSHSFSSFAGSTAVTVTSSSSICSWTATKSASWITLSTTSGSGNGTVTVGVLANSSIYSRSGTATIAGKTFTVEQAGKFVSVPCSWTISPTSHSFSAFAGSIPVTVTSNCSWPVTKSVSWITLSTTSGSDNGTVTVGVLANPSTSSRSGTVTIGSLGFIAPPKTFNVSQEAAPTPVTYIYEYFQPYYSSTLVDWTGVALSNASNDDAASIEIVVRGTNGDLITEIYRYLPASGKTTFVINEAGSGWVRIGSDQPLSGLVFLGCGPLMADIPFVEDLEQNLVIPHIAQDVTWDTTVLLCNPQSSSVSVNVINVNEQGIMVAQRTVTLAANGSGSYLLSDLFGPVVTGKIYLQATSGISAFALYSSIKSGGSYFAGINAAVGSYY